MASNKPRPGEGITFSSDSRGNARYKVRVRVAGGESGGGQKFANGTFDTLTAARAFRDDKRNARRKGEVAIESKIPFREWAERWLLTQEASSKVRPTTITSYRTHVNRANRYIGGKAIGKVTRADIERIVSEYAAEGCSVTSSGYLLTRLRAIFKEAQEDGHIIRNPAARVKAQGAPKKQREAFTSAEFSKVKEQLKTGKDTAADFGLWLLTLSGARRGEIMGLRWSDIVLPVRGKNGYTEAELSRASVTIRRSRVRHGAYGQGREQVGKPKTSNGERTLWIGNLPEVIEALGAMRESQVREHGIRQVQDGWVALDAAGRPLDPGAWSDRWDAAVAAAGLPRRTLHAARHTSVTLLRNAGLPDHLIAAWHGHDENIMRGVYSHAQEDELRGLGAALARVVG